MCVATLSAPPPPLFPVALGSTVSHVRRDTVSPFPLFPVCVAPLLPVRVEEHCSPCAKRRCSPCASRHILRVCVRAIPYVDALLRA